MILQSRFHYKGYYYRPQTKFAKVMFLHVSVILSTGGGVPGQVHPPEPGNLDTDQVHPPGTRYTPRPVYAGRYGQQAGGTHPTGMHSCKN